MSADEPDHEPRDPEEGEPAPQGVFGNLPQTRPGARSPRRDAAAQRKRAGTTKAARPAEGPASARRAAPKQAREPVADPASGAAEPAASDEAFESAAPSREGAGGIEEVAWAGVAAAAEAATIGVRLATRALEAMRDAVDRR